MSEVETKGQRMARLARPVRTLTEALGIDKRRYLFLATILTESFKNDESAMDSIKTVLDLLHDEKINDREAAFLIFDFGWCTALNATNREIEKQIMGAVWFDKSTGELTDA